MPEQDTVSSARLGGRAMREGAESGMGGNEAASSLGFRRRGDVLAPDVL